MYDRLCTGCELNMPSEGKRGERGRKEGGKEGQKGRKVCFTQVQCTSMYMYNTCTCTLYNLEWGSEAQM